jgi:hypothetical protein
MILRAQKDIFLPQFVITDSVRMHSAVRLMPWAVFLGINLSDCEAPFSVGFKNGWKIDIRRHITLLNYSVLSASFLSY